MSSQSKENGTTYQRSSPEKKTRIVRRYLKDPVGMADLAEKTGSTPGLILGWAKQALEGIEQTFSREMQQQRKFCIGRSGKRTTGSGSWNRLFRNSPPGTCC